MDPFDEFKIVLQELKIPFSEKGNRLELRCCWHDDKNPSAAVYKSSGLFYCWSCELVLDFTRFRLKVLGKDNNNNIPSLHRTKFDQFKTLAYLRLKKEAIVSLKKDLSEMNKELFWDKMMDKLKILKEIRDKI